MTPDDYELAARAIQTAMAEQRRILEENSPDLLPEKAGNWIGALTSGQVHIKAGRKWEVLNILAVV